MRNTRKKRPALHDGEPDVYRSCAANLRAVRYRRGLTQEQLAEMSGMSANYIGNLERAERKPSVATVHRLARILDVDTSTFFAEADRPPRPAKPRDELDRQIAALTASLDVPGKRKLIRLIREIFLR
jgi:transcriptional regulator with XRE-family HTH domain